MLPVSSLQEAPRFDRFPWMTAEYAVLILTISSVISAEMLNTAAEELADLSAADYNPLALSLIHI